MLSGDVSVKQYLFETQKLQEQQKLRLLISNPNKILLV